MTRRLQPWPADSPCYKCGRSGNLVELVNWLLVRITAAEARANTAEAQCADLTIENLQLAVKAGMMADIPETELRARTAGRIAEVEDKLVAAETREREAVASRDVQWRNALIAKGTAAESWAEHGPQNPDEAAIFRAEYDRVDGEYRTASVAKARADAFAEVVALCRNDGESDDTDDGFLPYGDKWADRIEELGKKGAV